MDTIGYLQCSEDMSHVCMFTRKMMHHLMLFSIMASITIFLNDVPEADGGELIYPKPEDGEGKVGESVAIHPTKGLAVVHHNTDEQYNFDKATLHEEAILKKGYKYIAKKYVYLNPQPNHMRIVLPIMALPFGGKLPKVFSTLQNTLIESHGPENAETYFRKIVTMIPVLVLIGIAQLVSNFVQGKLNAKKEDGDEKKKTKDTSDGKSKKYDGKAKKSKSKSKKA